MKATDTVQVVIELPRWLYLMLRHQAERQGVQPAVFATHLLRIAIALKPQGLRAALERLERMRRVRELWLRHHSIQSIATELGASRETVSEIVHQLSLRDRKSA
jgi:NADH:ubiquinone oxidoreductase subunit E